MHGTISRKNLMLFYIYDSSEYVGCDTQKSVQFLNLCYEALSEHGVGKSIAMQVFDLHRSLRWFIKENEAWLTILD